MEFIKTEDEVITEKRVAREILSMIEEICFSKKFLEYRCNNGKQWTKRFDYYEYQRKVWY